MFFSKSCTVVISTFVVNPQLQHLVPYLSLSLLSFYILSIITCSFHVVIKFDVFMSPGIVHRLLCLIARKDQDKALVFPKMSSSFRRCAEVLCKLTQSFLVLLKMRRCPCAVYRDWQTTFPLVSAFIIPLYSRMWSRFRIVVPPCCMLWEDIDPPRFPPRAGVTLLDCCFRRRSESWPVTHPKNLPYVCCSPPTVTRTTGVLYVFCSHHLTTCLLHLCVIVTARCTQ